MAETIGDLQLSLGLQNNISPELNRVLSDILKLSKGGKDAQDSFKDVVAEIKKLEGATKSIRTNANGKTISTPFSTSDVKTAINNVTTLSEKILSINRLIERINSTGLGVNVSGLQRQAQEYADILSHLFNTTNKNTLADPLNIRSFVTDKTGISSLIDLNDKATKQVKEKALAEEKAAKQQQKNQERLEKEYIKNSNYVQRDIRMYNERAKRMQEFANQVKIAYPKVDASSLDNAVRRYKEVVDVFRELQRYGQTFGMIPNEMLNNARDVGNAAYRRAQTNMVDVRGQIFDDKQATKAFNQFIADEQRLMSQNDKLIDSYRRIEEAKAKLEQSKGVASPSEQAQINSQIAKLDQYKQKLEEVERTKLGDKLAFRGDDGKSLVGATLKNMLAESDTLANSIRKNNESFIKDMKNLDMLKAKHKEVLDLIERVKAAQASGSNMGWNSMNNGGMSRLQQDLTQLQAIQADIQRYMAGAPMPADAFGKVFGQNIASIRSDVNDMNKSIEKTIELEDKRIAQAKDLVVAQEAVKKIITGIEAQMASVDAAMSKAGVSDATKQSLQGWKDALERIKADYGVILADQSMIKDKAILAVTRTDRDNAFLGSKEAIAKAEAEARNEKKVLNERQSAIAQLKDYVLTLQTELGKLSTKTYHPNVDTTSLDSAKRKTQDLIDKFDRMRADIESGKSLADVGYDKNAIRYEKKDASSNLSKEASNANDLSRALEKADRATRRKTDADREAARAAKQNEDAVKKLISEYEKLSKASERSSSRLSQLKDLFMQFAPVYGLQQAVMSIIQVGGEIEKQHIAMQSILGDLHNANELFGQIKNLALESPFKFGELNKDVKQLAAYGVEYDELYNTTKRLADISAGLGVSFERIALAYGQVKSRSWLDGKELRQFAYAGVPLLSKLAEMYSKTSGETVSTSQVKKMISNRQVSFEDVQNVLWEMTDVGGKFFNMQSTLAETLYGRYNKLIDAWEIMLSGFAKGDHIIGGTFKFIIDMITKLVLSINTIAPALMAAFAPRAIANLFGKSTNLGFRDKILSAKGAEADSIRKKIATNENYKMTAYEQNILATEKKITAEEVKRLAVANQLNRQELRQLYLKGEITKQDYQQLAAEGKKLALVTQYTGKLGVGLIAGAKGAFSAITGFFGGPWMMAITIAIGALTYFWQKAKEVEASVKEMQSSLQDRWAKINSFVKENRFTLRIAYNADDEKQLMDLFDKYKEKLEEVNSERAKTIIARANSNDDLKQRVMYLEQQLELMEEGNKIADQYSGDFVEGTTEGFEEAAEAAKKYQKRLNMIDDTFKRFKSSDYDRIQKKFAEAGFTEQSYELRRMRMMQPKEEVDQELKYWGFTNPQVNMRDVGMPMFDYLQNEENELDVAVKSLAKKISEKIPNIGKDPKVDEAYRQLREELETKLELAPEIKSVINLKLDKALGLSGEDDARKMLTEKVANMALSSSDSAIEKMAFRWKMYGYDALSKEEKELVKKLMDDASKQLELRFPSFEDTFRRLISGMDATIPVQVEAELGEFNDIQKQILSKIPEDDKQTREKVGSWLSQGSLSEARDQAAKEVKELKKNLDDLKDQNGKKGEDLSLLIKEAQTKYDRRVYAQGFVGVRPDKDKSGRNSKDKELERWRRWLRLLKEYRAEYEKERKRVGEVRAKAILKNRHEFDELTNPLAISIDELNPDNERWNIARFQEQVKKRLKLTTEARKTFVGVDVPKEKYDVDYKLNYRNAEALSELNNKFIDDLTQQYDDFQKLEEKFGRINAKKFAFGGNNPSLLYLNASSSNIENGFDLKSMEDFYEYIDIGSDALDKVDMLRKRISSHIKDASKLKPKMVGMSPESLFKTTREEMEEMFGDDKVNEVYRLVKDLEAEEKRIRQIGIEKVSQILDLYTSNASNIIKVANELEYTIKYINSLEHVPQKDKDKLIETAKINAGARLVEFGNDNMYLYDQTLTATIERIEKAGEAIKKNLDDRLKKGLISAKQYSDEMEKIRKAVKDAKSRKGEFATYIGSGVNGVLDNRYKRGKEKFDLGASIKSDASEMLRLFNSGDRLGALKIFDKLFGKGGPLEGMYSSTDLLLNGMDKISEGASKAGEDMMAAGSDAMNGANKMSMTVAIIDKIVHGIDGVIQGIKGAYDQINEMLQSFGDDSMEYSDFGGALSALSAGSSSASKAWGSFKNGDIGGVISGVVGTFAGPIVALNKHHDKKLQKQIDLAEEQIKLLGNLKENLEHYFERTMGGAYGTDTKSNPAAKRQIDALNSMYRTNVKLPSASTLGIELTDKDGFKKGTSAELKKAINEMNASGSYYDAMYASLIAQRDEANKKLIAEQDKKDSDDSAIADYQQELEGLNQQIDDFAQEMANSLYGIDFKSWASNFADALVNAWASGTNAAKAYKDAVSDILKNVATSVIQQKYIEQMLTPLMDEFLKDFEDNDGKVSTNATNILTKMFDIANSAQQVTNDAMNSIEQQAQSRGYTLKNKSTGLSAAVAGVTEDTADLLASYINSVRSYVAMQNTYLQKMAEEQMPHVSATLDAQLNQLKQIQANTYNTAYAIGELRDMIHNTTLGINPIGIRMV